jgi:hypothetical protein
MRIDRDSLKETIKLASMRLVRLKAAVLRAYPEGSLPAQHDSKRKHLSSRKRLASALLVEYL